jgi:hypothetical protein
MIVDYLRNRVPDGMVLVPQSTLDSLNAYIELSDSLQVIANLPPDTIYILDTVYIKDPVSAVTTPYSEEEGKLTYYEDSLKVENEIDVEIAFTSTGKLTTPIYWEYTPIIHEIETIIEKKIPYPILTTIEVEVPKYYNGHYLSLVVGGNDKMFNFGVDYDFVKENHIYGFQYRKYGEQNVYGVKIGINLSTLFKR